MAGQLASFINLFGVIEADGHAQLDTVIPVDSMPQWPVSEALQADPIVFAEFQDKGGIVLLRHAIGFQPFCMHPVSELDVPRVPDEHVFGGILPVPPDASILRITDANSILAERKIPENGPEVNFDWDPFAGAKDGVQKIAWEASHPDGEPLVHTLCLVRQEGTWQALALPSQVTEVEINFDELSGRAVALGVISTDGFHVTRARSAIFQLPVKPCIATIISPVEGSRFSADEHVLLSGYGYYRETSSFENKWLFWFDEIEGELGLGREIDVVMKPGQHKITLRAGWPGREGETQVTVLIEEKP